MISFLWIHPNRFRCRWSMKIEKKSLFPINWSKYSFLVIQICKFLRWFDKISVRSINHPILNRSIFKKFTPIVTSLFPFIFNFYQRNLIFPIYFRINSMQKNDWFIHRIDPLYFVHKVRWIFSKGKQIRNDFFCHLDLTEENFYTFYFDNEQTSNHQSLVFSFQELNSSDCSKNSIFMPYFTSDFYLRIYISGCYYLDENDEWQSNGFIVSFIYWVSWRFDEHFSMKVGPKTNLYQTHCISSQFNWHFRFSCCCLLPFFPLIALEIILMLFVSRQMSVSNWRWISFCSFFAINRRISSLLVTSISRNKVSCHEQKNSTGENVNIEIRTL